MYTHFPAIRPYTTHLLAVSDHHQIYVEECGNPEGIPILIVHGGPGLGIQDQMRCYCDPNLYRMILFDQRGCGRSLPHGELSENTTQDLLADMEKIREFLKIEQWVVLGGSFGSLLSLLYAEQHPLHVRALLLRSVFLNTAENYNWLLKDGVRLVFPDYWEDMIRHIPAEQQHNLLGGFYHQLTSDDDIARMSAAKAWAMFQTRCGTLNPNPHLVEMALESSNLMTCARIALHYLSNFCFVEKDQVTKNLHRIEHIQTIIIHGRYDMICPIANAYTLQRALPNSQLQIIRDAGHSESEPGIIDALIHATELFAQQFSAA